MSNLVHDDKANTLALIYCALLSESSEKALAVKHDFTLRQFLDTYRDSTVVGLQLDRRLVGGMFFCDGRVHLGIMPDARSRWVYWLKPMLDVGFEKFGPRLIARVGVLNLRAQQFVERVGCVRGEENEHYIEYEVLKERMRYVRDR